MGASNWDPWRKLPNPQEGVLRDSLHPTNDPDEPNADLYGPPPGGRKNRDPDRRNWLAWVILIAIVLGAVAWVVFFLH